MLVFSPYYPPAYLAGGPIKSVSQLVRSEANEFPTYVVSRDWDLGAAEPLREHANRWTGTGGGGVWAFDRGMLRYARAMTVGWRLRPKLVYINSLFDPWTGLVPAFLWLVLGSRRCALVVAPRGQLGFEALRHSAFRKRVLLRVWRFIARRRRALVHAASIHEQERIEKCFGRVKVLLRPNEVGPLLPNIERVEIEGAMRAVFLGRLVPIKGLLELLESLRNARVAMTLDVIGPFEDKRIWSSALRQPRDFPIAWR